MLTENRRAGEIRVLHIVPTYYPAVAFGGPIFSTKAICDCIANLKGFSVHVLTTNAASEKKRDRLCLVEKSVQFSDGYLVRYCRRDAGVSISLELLFRIPGAILRSDVIHLTGPYNFPTIPTLFFCRLFRRPVVWSPRGGFQATEQWENAPHRRLKSAFEWICDLIRPPNTILHVTAMAEKELSRSRFRKIETVLIPNSVRVPENLPERSWQPGGRLRVVFISRLHEKKGLEDLIEAMTLVPESVTLDIFGAGAEEYIASLQEWVSKLACRARVRFHGHVDGDAKRRAFVGGDVFCLPTHSENFGIVIAEALAHGTPVITTVNAPWQQIEQVGCGLWVSSGPQSLANAILDLDGKNLKEMGARGRDWIKREFSEGAMSDALSEKYRKIAGK